MTKNNYLGHVDSSSNRKARRDYQKRGGDKIIGTNVPVVEYLDGRKKMRANGIKKLSQIYANQTSK